MSVDLGQLGLDHLLSFVAVVRRGGFRGAAVETGRSASTLSLAVRTLEDRLGVRLVNRTTRSVAVTEAGDALLARLEPALAEITRALDGVNAFRDSARGTLRLNMAAPAATLSVAPLLPAFFERYPEIQVELRVESSLVDIVEGGYDAGVRWGESLQLDMIAVSLGPPQRFVVAGAPALVARLGGAPTDPEKLLYCPCLRLRFESGSLLPWEFERDGKEYAVNTTGPLTSNNGEVLLRAALDGIGFVYTFEESVAEHVAAGRLQTVLEVHCPSFPGPFLYYPAQRHQSAPLKAFVDFIQARRKRRE